MTMRSATKLLLMGVVATVALTACGGDGDPGATELGEGAKGWCLDIPPEQDQEVTKLPRVDCSEGHTHEVMAVVESKYETYPGFEALETEAQLECLDRFEEFIGVSPFDSTLFYSWMVPSLASWADPDIENSTDEPGDREIICVVGPPGGGTVPPGDRLEGSER